MKIVYILILLVVNVFCQAQDLQKIGHADWQYIFSQLREYKQIEADLSSFESQLQNHIFEKQEEFREKYKMYISLPESTSVTVRKEKETELLQLEENLKKLHQEAQHALAKKQAELTTPVFARIGKAIEDVASENGFSYIFNPKTVEGSDLLLFADQKFEISGLVIRKLNDDKGESKNGGSAVTH